MKKRGGKQDLTLPQQLLFLKANSIVGGAGNIRANRLTWHTSVQPTALAREYQVSITYVIGKTPAVQIDEPDLEILAAGRHLPHIYMNPLRLCLHLPGTGDWDATKRIDQTIIPWTHKSQPLTLAHHHTRHRMVVHFEPSARVRMWRDGWGTNPRSAFAPSSAALSAIVQGKERAVSVLFWRSMRVSPSWSCHRLGRE